MNHVSYYGFTKNPFDKFVDYKEISKSNDCIQIQGRLTSAIEYGGIALITGKSGTGKSTAVKAYIKELDKEKYKVVYIQAIELSMFDFYQTVCNQLDVGIGGCHKMEMVNKIHERIIELKERKIKPIVIIDDADVLSNKIIEELRIFYDYGINEECSISVVLIANTIFRSTIKRERFESLKDRIMVNYDMNGLSYTEFKEYIVNRCRNAGVEVEMFNEQNYSTIYDICDKNPRKINTIMNNVLMMGYINEVKTFTNKEIIAAKSEMEI